LANVLKLLTRCRIGFRFFQLRSGSKSIDSIARQHLAKWMGSGSSLPLSANAIHLMTRLAENATWTIPSSASRFQFVQLHRGSLSVFAQILRSLSLSLSLILRSVENSTVSRGLNLIWRLLWLQRNPRGVGSSGQFAKARALASREFLEKNWRKKPLTRRSRQRKCPNSLT